MQHKRTTRKHNFGSARRVTAGTDTFKSLHNGARMCVPQEAPHVRKHADRDHSGGVRCAHYTEMASWIAVFKNPIAHTSEKTAALPNFSPMSMESLVVSTPMYAPSIFKSLATRTGSVDILTIIPNRMATTITRPKAAVHLASHRREIGGAPIVGWPRWGKRGDVRQALFQRCSIHR